MGAMIRGLLGNDLLLDGSQQLLRLGQGQPKVRHGAEPNGSLECHHVVAARLTLYTDFYQPHDPGHALTPGIGQTPSLVQSCRHSQFCGSPAAMHDRDSARCVE
jgi:hypothetical protein